MPTVTYTAKRSLVSGHVANDDYSILFRLKEHDPETKGRKEVSEALSGRTETIFINRTKEHALTTQFFTVSEAALFMEFLDSVLDGRPFTFDRYAVALDGNGDSVPVAPVVCELLDDNIKPRRVGKSTSVYFSFKIREVV